MSNAKVRARRRRRAKARKAQIVYYDIETATIQLGATSPPIPIDSPPPPRRQSAARTLLMLAALASLRGRF